MTETALSELLLMLEAEWLRLRAPLAGRLRPGLGPAEVHAKVAALSLTAPDDLVTFFGWHDGADGSDVYEQEMFVDDLRLVTLDEAIEETRSQRELSSQVSTPPAFVLWPEPWVLLCRGRGGQELALDCSPGQASLPFLKDRDQAAVSTFDGDLEPFAPRLADVVERWVGDLASQPSPD